jgi:hypothetical protein
MMQDSAARRMEIHASRPELPPAASRQGLEAGFIEIAIREAVGKLARRSPAASDNWELWVIPRN